MIMPRLPARRALLAQLASGPDAPQQPPAVDQRPELTIDPATIMTPLKGELDAMIERRLIRVLVAPSKTFYFQDRGVQRGVTYDAFRIVEHRLNAQLEKDKKLKQKNLKVRFVFLPVGRD